LPAGLAKIASVNPMTAAIDGLRATLLGGAGWSEVGQTLVIVVPGAALALTLGIVAFRLAARRERRSGTIGLY
jgi:ABC-type polysaccharide/polyol phosphate export permease